MVHDLTTKTTLRPIDGDGPDRGSGWPASAPIDLDRARELETENALLRARVVELNRRLDDLSAQRRDLERMLVPGDDDGSVEAFEAFLAAPDPHLDKVRRFLLD